MPILRMKEINAMTPADRTKKLGELRAELSRLRTMIHAGGAIENPTRVREIRKTIAQVLTVENEVKLGIRQGAKSVEAKKPKVAEKKIRETNPE